MSEPLEYTEGVGVAMVTGWRRFFTRTYWRIQWLSLRNGGRLLNVVAVGTLHVPDEES